MRVDGASENRETWIGGTAVLMWATLALLTTLSGDVPPFQLTALSFSIATLIGGGFWWQQRLNPLRRLRLPLAVWALGIYGLFGYHFLYFMALRHAPAIEAGLIAYLWPLLIVLLAGLLPDQRLRWFHLAGAALGFGGAALLVTNGSGLSFQSQYGLGYGLALACAFTWSSYSVLSRRLGHIPTDAVGGFCLATAVLAWGCHWLFETAVWPVGTEWLAVLGLGLGPVGLAFYTWDVGVKRGNIQLLGTFSYAAPLLSTLLLILFGQGTLTWAVGIACLLIIGGAVLASRKKSDRSELQP